MSKRVCPWWIGYILASPLRRLFSNPRRLLEPYVREGMKVLEPGPGMGFFTLELARMVGPSGRVIAVDIQDRMLSSLKRRASRAGLLDRIEIRLVPPNSMQLENLNGKIDFTLAFAMVHEMPAVAPFFQQVAAASRPGAQILLAEPAGHVNIAEFEEELKAAESAGFKLSVRPPVGGSHAALLTKET